MNTLIPKDNIKNEVKKNSSPVQSISRAADILNCISEGANSITEIANYCKLSKSTAHRLLHALIESNLVTQDPVKRQYYLGYLVTHLLAKPEITNEFLVACARDEVQRLAEFTGETISFGIMVALRYINLISIPSKYDLRVVEEPPRGPSPDNHRSDIYVGAAGRVLLSQLNSKELKTATRCINLLPITQYSMIDKEQLGEQIDVIHRQGYATSTGERSAGAMCLAAPVKNYELPATLYMLGPETRLKPRLPEYMDNLLNSANRISLNISQVFQLK